MSSDAAYIDNERYWDFTGGFVHIYNRDRVLSVLLLEQYVDIFGKWHQSGRFRLYSD